MENNYFTAKVMYTILCFYLFIYLLVFLLINIQYMRKKIKNFYSWEAIQVWGQYNFLKVFNAQKAAFIWSKI